MKITTKEDVIDYLKLVQAKSNKRDDKFYKKEIEAVTNIRYLIEDYGDNIIDQEETVVSNLQVGDPVRVGSLDRYITGPVMIIATISGTKAYCMWFSTTERQWKTHTFPLCLLVGVK